MNLPGVEQNVIPKTKPSVPEGYGGNWYLLGSTLEKNLPALFFWVVQKHSRGKAVGREPNDFLALIFETCCLFLLLPTWETMIHFDENIFPDGLKMVETTN